MSTFAQDYRLPPLPVPKLADTCRNLRSLVKPLVGDTVMAELSRALDDFEGGQGPCLQELLLRWAEEQGYNRSWLRPIWDDVYLSSRVMLPVNMNYAFRFVRGRWGKDSLPALMSGLARVTGSMRSESLPAEHARQGALSMDTLACMIYTRIPGKVKDNWYYPPLSCPMTASVVCRGHWFILSLTNGIGEVLSPAAIAEAITQIRRGADSMELAAPVGAITCANRGTAAELRDMLQQCPANRMNLESIEKSLFTVCLDEPLAAGELFNLRLITGAPENRFFDKSLQIISDGEDVGVNIEHSGCDASIWVYLLNQVDALPREGTASDSGGAHIRTLVWNVSDAAAEKIKSAAKGYQAVVGKLSFADRRIPALSKEKIKEMKCSPDAFVQLLFQAAYYKLTGCLRSVYEAVSTRGFYQGRTECVRPVTEESAAFVRAIETGLGKEELTDGFSKAVQAHVERIRRAQSALGSERHMAGLSMMARINDIPLPKVFASEGYRTLRHDALSTSSTTAPFIDFFSFGPVVEDGIGIGYGIKPEGLHVAVSAYGDSTINPSRYLEELEIAAQTVFMLNTN